MIRQMLKRFPRRSMLTIVALSLLVTTVGTAFSAPETPQVDPEPAFSTAVAFDVSPAARDLAQPVTLQRAPVGPSPELREIRPDRGPVVPDQGFSGDGALQGSSALEATVATASATIPSPLLTFEGLSNEDNRAIYGGRVAPPDPIGDVGPNHYVEMVNLVFAVYDKQGNLLLGPLPIGSLWEGFEVEDCTDPSGDPIVLYDQLEDRWILSQFTTRGLDDPTLPFYDCVAISQTGDPTGAYYRYAFITQPNTVDGGYFFPDYPKYGVWTDSYILTTRDFGLPSQYGISVYALEKNKMLEGNPNARAVQFFLDSNEVPLYLIGDGLLPPDIDGHRRPRNRVPAPIVGTMDDGAFYGASSDALNIWELWVQWMAKPVAWLRFAAQLPVAEFDSVFPCFPDSRDCIPQPGITDRRQYLDVLSSRQRPMWRLAYRNFGQYEALVTNQAVEARPGMAGVRWYEIRRANNGAYSLNQQGTYAPDDGVHRWMGSIAMDWQGNMALGYSVSNAVDVYPGIRYTGRLSGDPLGEMSLGEATVIDGTGSQLWTGSRWGDYTSMNIDPVDDCTFWYVNQYYAITELAAWQTRIASFILPGCTPQTE